MDAGQPDSNQINSLLALVATKEKEKSCTSSVNHIKSNEQSRKNSQSTPDKENCSTDPKTNQKTAKPNINVTTNPLDISLCAQAPCNTQTSIMGARGRGKSTGKINFYFLSKARNKVEVIFMYLIINIFEFKTFKRCLLNLNQ